ncbi:MAG: hypothetical protein LKH39_00040 [Atopobiaceae bacterium]|jgi:hypothetical protein|nr:hypothetical protein [Atopobiaceae bacterium]
MAGIFMGMALEELDHLGMAAAEAVAAYGHDDIMLLLEACCRLEVERFALLWPPLLLHLPDQEVLEDCQSLNRPMPSSLNMRAVRWRRRITLSALL